MVTTIGLVLVRAKTTNLRRDPRVVLHVAALSAWSCVAFTGEIEMSPVPIDPDNVIAGELVASFEAVSGGPSSGRGRVSGRDGGGAADHRSPRPDQSGRSDQG